MKTTRVPFDELDITDNLIVLWKDKPFTGIGYDLNADGKLWSEMTYVNGLQEGFSKEWSTSGTLIVEEQWKRGNLHGFVHEWFENSKLKSKAVREFGILVSKKEWDSEGHLTLTFQITEKDLEYDVLVAYRRKYGEEWGKVGSISDE